MPRHVIVPLLRPGWLIVSGGVGIIVTVMACYIGFGMIDYVPRLDVEYRTLARVDGSGPRDYYVGWIQMRDSSILEVRWYIDILDKRARNPFEEQWQLASLERRPHQIVPYQGYYRGWPFACVHVYRSTYGADGGSGMGPKGTSWHFPQYLLDRVLWRRFCGNVLIVAGVVYGGVVVVVAAWTYARRRHRPLDQLCPACGYSHVGAVSDRCPECGEPVPDDVHRMKYMSNSIR